MLNKVQLIGHLGADPEVRHLNSGGKVVNLRIATSESWKDKNGERQTRTEWHTVVIWNEKLGDIAEEYLTKGSLVYIAGKLQTRKWQDKDGNDRYSTEVVLANFDGEIKMLGSKNNRDDDDQPQSRGSSQQRSSQGSRNQSSSRNNRDDDQRNNWLDDNIPF